MKSAALLAGALLLVPHLAEAATCTPRPTDAGGYQGYDYGAATVKSYATTRVRVHYATSGPHAPNLATTRQDGVPDTVAFAADTGEQALTKYGAMGYKAPPSDAACASNGDDDKLDVYLVTFAGADGTTIPVDCNGRVCASWVLCESTFAGRGYKTPEEGFQTVITHELFHTVQNAYDQGLDRFWAEGTAQWAMQVVHPGLPDFIGQMPAFFAEPTRSIDTQPSGVTAGYLYGSSVWPLFLATKFGEDTVRLTLEAEADGTGSIAAVDKVLQGKGSSIGDAFPLFWAWNVATKALAGSDGYPDAASYPGVKLGALADGTTAITSGLGAFLYRAQLDAAQAISIDTDPARNAAVVVPIVSGKANLAGVQKLPATISGDVVVVVTGITTKKTDAPFTLHLAEPRVDPPVTPSSSGGGGGGDGGGCGIAPARTSALPSALLVLGLALVARRARRTRA